MRRAAPSSEFNRELLENNEGSGNQFQVRCSDVGRSGGREEGEINNLKLYRFDHSLLRPRIIGLGNNVPYKSSL